MIRLLRLSNFKCFANQSLELADITLLSGLNGMGKSTVIQSILLLRQSHQQGLLEATGLALKGELVSLGTAKDALYENAGLEDTIDFEIVFQDGKRGLWQFKYNQTADVMDLAASNADKSIYRTNIFGDNFHYLQAERIGPRASFKMSDFIVREHRQLGPKGEYTAHFLSLFGERDIPISGLHHDRAISCSLRNEVEAWIGDFSPGTRIQVSSNLEMDLVGLRYSFVSGSHESNTYRATNVGFGITYILPILVATLSAVPGSLLLIENPEAHLHPKGQALMGHLLARAASFGLQIVVETHSDHVLNGIRVAVHERHLAPEKVRLHYFDRWSPDGLLGQHYVVSPTMDQDGRIDLWPDGFFDEWDKSLEALLTSRTT